MDSVRDGLLLTLRCFQLLFFFSKGCVCHVVLLRGTTMFSRIGDGMASKLVRRTDPSSTMFNTTSRGRSSLSLCTSSLVLEKGKLSLDGIESMCFSGSKLRHRAQSVSESLDKEKTHVFPDDIISRCVEKRLQPVSLAAEFTAPLHHEG